MALESLKETYAKDEDFSKIWQKSVNHEELGDFFYIRRFFVQEQHVMPTKKKSLREAVIKKIHVGVLGGHLGQDKNRIQLEDRLY